MKKIALYLSSALLTAFLFGAIPHPALAAYDADGNPVGNDNKNSVYDASEDADENESPTPEENGAENAPAVHPHKVVVTPEMATTPPQPPPVPAAAPPIPQPPPGPARASSLAAGGKGNWWHPHPGTKWQIQYAGHIDPSVKVDAFDLDLVDTDPMIIQQLKDHGVKVICYFSAGSYEGWRPDARQFPASVQGKPNGWKDEKWLDIRRLDILKPIMQARIEMAAQKGCDAVDPDNVEAFENNSGFPLKGSDQMAYNKMIAGLAHAAGLAVALKNDSSQVETLLPYFDFQVNEQCFEYKSCEDVVPFIKANKPVLNVEYKLSTAQFCAEANKLNFDSLKKNLNLDAKVEACR